MKPVTNIVVSIDSGRNSPEPQGPAPVSARSLKKSSGDYGGRRRQALRLFFLMGSGVWKCHRQMGVPTRELENDLRELAWPEWRRKYGKKAA